MRSDAVMGRLIGAAVLCALALATGTGQIAGATGSWSAPAQLFTSTGGGHDYAAFDKSGHVHMALGGNPDDGQGLWYVTETSRTRVIKGRADGTRSVFDTAIAYRVQAGRPIVRIAWVDRDLQDAIWITRNDSGQWVSSRVRLGVASGLSIANLGRGVAIAFQDNADRLRYLTWDPVTGPSGVAVVAMHCCASAPSLAVRNGVPSIAFSEDRTDGVGGARLRFATRAANGAWPTQTVDAHATMDPSSAFTVGGAPVIAYDVYDPHVGAGWHAWYARRSGSGWQKRQALTAGYWDPRIATDGSGAIGVVANNESSVFFRRLDMSGPATAVLRSDDTGGCFSDDALGFAAGRATVVGKACRGCPDLGVSDVYEIWVIRQ